MTIHAFKHAGTVQNATADETTTLGWTATELYSKLDGDPVEADTNYSAGRITGNRFDVAYQYVDPTWRHNTPIRIDLTALPAGKTITSATLWLRLMNSAGDASALALAARRLEQPFVEAEATWNNRATATPWAGSGNTAGGLSNVATGNVASTTVAGTVDTWHQWDVTSYVQGVYASTFSNHGLLMIRDTVTPDASVRRFANHNHVENFAPELIVVYEDAVAVGPTPPFVSITVGF